MEIITSNRESLGGGWIKELDTRKIFQEYLCSHIHDVFMDPVYQGVSSI